MRRAALGMALWTAAVLTLAGDQPALQRFELDEPHMGTTVRLVLYAPDRAAAERAARAAFARVAALDAELSDYRPESELSRLVARAGGAPVAISEDLFAVLEASQRIALASGGAFDMAAGALTQLWRGARRLSELPSRERIAAAKAMSGFQHLRLDAAARTAAIDVRGVRLDPGGIAKGYAADAARAVLDAHRLPRALVVVGGDVAAGDPPPGARGWQVAIAPLGATAIPALVISRAAVSTSGDAEQWMTVDGTRYSHIIDPRTGWPVTGRSSTTVVAPRGIDADALSTALSIVTRSDGEGLIAGVPGAAALWQWQEPDGAVVVRHSDRWPAP